MWLPLPGNGLLQQGRGGSSPHGGEGLQKPVRGRWVSPRQGRVWGGPWLTRVPPPRSGLTHEAHRKEVEQVYLRCSAGSVEWMYPTGALIVNVRPNTFPPSRHLTLCIKPLRDSSGANIYLERTGELKLLVRDGDRGPGQVLCFGFEHGGLFVEAAPQQDISRRTTGFQYELTSRHAGSDLHALSGGWRALVVGRAAGWGLLGGFVGGRRHGGASRRPPGCRGYWTCGAPVVLRNCVSAQGSSVPWEWPQAGWTVVPAP